MHTKLKAGALRQHIPVMASGSSHPEHETHFLNIAKNIQSKLLIQLPTLHQKAQDFWQSIGNCMIPLLPVINVRLVRYGPHHEKTCLQGF